MKQLSLAVAVLAILLGIIWIGQGSGYFPYPSSSFMINEAAWIYRGALLAAIGLAAAVLITFWSRRR